MTPHRLFLPAVLLALAGPAWAADLPAAKVEMQPLAAQARRVADALELLGAPLSAEERKALTDAKDVGAVQAVLDKYCLAAVHIAPPKNGEVGPAASRWLVAAQPGPAKPELAEQGWRVFLVKVYNPAGADKLELRRQPQRRPAYQTLQRQGRPASPARAGHR